MVWEPNVSWADRLVVCRSGHRVGDSHWPISQSILSVDDCKSGVFWAEIIYILLSRQPAALT